MYLDDESHISFSLQYFYNSYGCGAQAAGAEKVEAVDNMYLVSKELSFDSRNFRLDFYFQGTSEGMPEFPLFSAAKACYFVSLGLYRERLQSCYQYLDWLALSAVNVTSDVSALLWK